ncbi:MAG: protein kinase, partial [Pirellulales bacterium]|nr:protein kinase [Pirellulales bacterium]
MFCQVPVRWPIRSILTLSGWRLPDEQPPNHYRLLGVPLFADSPETIEHAADQRMLLLRTFQGGKHGASANKLLNEVAAARVCLLNPEKRIAYDRQLRSTLKPQAARNVGSAGDETVEWAGLQELGNYRFIEKLGEGGMGAVFKALHTKLGRVVAVKLVRSDHAWDERAIARFEREMRAAGAVDHPNVVRAMDAGEIGGTRFLAMEFVNGLTATELVRRCHPLPVASACEMIRQAALGLQAAHEHNLIHRDIKTSNLMVARDGTVKVLDLGLARFHREGSPEEALTGTGQALGTIDYMAPEQLAESRSVDIRADIYSLGCTLYALLAGHAPFATAEYEGTIKKAIAHAEKPVPPIRHLRPDVPPEMARIVGRMLEKDPAKRFATPREVAEALGPLSIGHELPAIVARAENRPVPQAQPAGAMTDTHDSQSSGLTKFFQTIKGKPEWVVSGTKAAGKSPRIKPAVIGYVGIGLVCALAVVMLALRGGSGSTAEETVLALDWPDAERAGSVLSIDGKAVAVPPRGSLRYPCPPGKHRLRITRPEFHPFEQTILVEAGREARLRPVWVAESYLILQWPLAEQRDATAEIDGTRMDLSILPRGDDWASIRVPIEPGPHQVTIARVGYEPFERRVTVEAGRSVTVTPEWKALAETAATQPSASAGKPPEEPMPGTPEAIVPQPAAVAVEVDEPKASLSSAEQADPKPQSGALETKPVSPEASPEPDPALKRQQELDAKYTAGMEAVEKLVAAWDFRGAWAALDSVRFGEPELTLRLAQRRDEIRRMGTLQMRMIQKINAASPPLKKTDLMLRGVNGQVTTADEEGITAALAGGKSELHSWAEMTNRCRENLTALVIDPQT